MSDAPLKTCPKELCGLKKWGKGKVKKAISAGAGLIFKGSGFYITDYRSDNYKAGAKKDAPATPSSGGDSKARFRRKQIHARQIREQARQTGQGLQLVCPAQLARTGKVTIITKCEPIFGISNSSLTTSNPSLR